MHSPTQQPSHTHTSPSFTITPAITSSDLETIRSFFKAYTTWLNLDLAFQNYEQELASLPGKYSPPHGCLLLARRTPSRRLPGRRINATGEHELADPERVEESRSEDEAVLGCVALRPLPPSPSTTPSHSSTSTASEATTTSPPECELKRLYVTPSGRGLGVGRALVLAALAKAREAGYTVVRLDTLGSMTAARRLYGDLGFVEGGAYYATPLEGTVFMEMRLQVG